MKDQIAAAGYEVDAIAERVRRSQEKGERDEAKEAADRVWREALATDPDEWSDELKDRILELVPDSTIEEIAEGIRKRQEHRRNKGDEGHERLEELGRRLRAAVAAGEMTEEEARQKLEAIRREHGARATDLEELQRRVRAAVDRGAISPEEAREILARARQEQSEHTDNDRLDDFKRGVIERAMATPVDEWDDRLKAAIERAGWDLDEFTEGIRKRQAHRAERAGEAGEEGAQVEAGDQANTSVEARSWGQVKEEVGKDE